MFERKLFFAICTIFLALFPAIVTSQENTTCKPSSCGPIHNITFPFRLKGDRKNCGNYKIELSCENNRTLLYLSHGKYLVQEINYENFTIRLSDPGLQKDNCSSMPLYSLNHYPATDWITYYDIHDNDTRPTSVTFFNCENQVNSSRYVDASPCLNGGSSSSLLKRQYYFYVVLGDLDASELANLCSMVVTTLIRHLPEYVDDALSYLDIHNGLVHGLELSWYKVNSPCDEPYDVQFDNTPVLSYNFHDEIERVRCHRLCFNFLYEEVFRTRILPILYHSRYLTIYAIASMRILFGLCMFAFLFYKWRRRHYSMYDGIEEFLHNNNNLMPIRYSYANIKKMTKGFHEKLGEGGFGSVYRGKLRSGRLVAVKMLGKSKANGQDFINEVSTIGRIHHVNVVQLVGYCVEGTKRALLYEFMPKGSLEKYIFHHGEGNISLSCKIIYEISLGVARGIEYLHRGCGMRILHFDIKPHNILLDENFTPKVSDFGLAKLYPTGDSIVNLTAARGTMGYMAPELFYQNIGGVSYKADVYSFGMLLMEMASKRKNLNAFAEHSSKIYFPSWVYDQFSEGNDIDIGDATEEEREITQKMVIVALWCIQMKPNDRPSMSKVVAMLEGNVELQMPPKPLLYPQQMSTTVQAGNDNPEGVPASSHNAMDTEPLVGR